jgi:type IV pilus assembly protein PilY1
MSTAGLCARRRLVSVVLAMLSGAAQPVPVIDLAKGPMLDCSVSGGMPTLIRAASRPATGLTVSPDGKQAYRTSFDPVQWSGSLQRFDLHVASGGESQAGTRAVWDAAKILTEPGEIGFLPPSDRRIYTASGAANSMVPVPFEWQHLDASQKAALDVSPGNGKYDGLGPKRLEYLRGVRDLERARGGIFRTRTLVMGDVINSRPVYAGNTGIDDGSVEYVKFRTAQQRRPKAVYVGANDGMLHAFDAATGRELFAYLPSVLVRHLNRLGAPDYIHRPYVDATVTVRDALVRDRWATVLAGGLGGGGQGVYALDVTDPTDFAGGRGVLFEFSDADDPDMGNLSGTTHIAVFQTRTTKGQIEYRHFVVVPGGVNNHFDDGIKRFSTSAASTIFLLSLDKDPSAKWQLNKNYYKFKLPVTDTALQNGVTSVALVPDHAGVVRRMYAADLQGNLWRLDFEGNAPWSNALGKTPSPLFVARDNQGNRQPVTGQPRIVFAANGGFLVTFGTGKFMEAGDLDPKKFSTQSFYALRDGVDRVSVDRSDLLSRSVRAVPTSSGTEYEFAAGDPDAGGKPGAANGWYFDFPESDAGERSISGLALLDGRVVFHSLIPPREVCGRSSGRRYQLDVLSGLPAKGHLTGALLGVSPLTPPAAVPDGRQVGNRSASGRRTVKTRTRILNSDPAAGAEEVMPLEETTSVAGRLGWREIFNWQELRDGYAKK